MNNKEIIVSRSASPSPGLEVSSSGMASRLPFANSLKKFWIRLRYAKDPNNDGVGAFRDSGTMFIRVPKNATSSVCDLLYTGVEFEHLPGHQSAEFFRFAVPKLFAKSLVCASIRDPRERFYSAFNYYRHSTKVPAERQLMDEELSFIQTMDDFISYLNGQPDLAATKIMRWHHFRRQVDFITDAKGRVIVDLLFPVEDSHDAIALLKKHSGFAGELERKNTSRGDRSGEWPDFLANYYRSDQSLWEQVFADKLVYPTDKISRLNLKPETP